MTANPQAPWRTLPPPAVAVLWIRGAQQFVRQNLALFGGAGTGAAISDAIGLREVLAATGLVLLGSLLVALVYQRRFRYRVDDAHIRVRSGLFQRTELEVRFERVQKVDISQPFYLRPLALRRVTLETPGAAQTEVELPGIAEAQAFALRDRVDAVRRSARNQAAVAEGSPCSAAERAADETLFAASASELFRAGLASNQVWLLSALLVATVANLAGERMDQWTSALIERSAVTASPALAAALLVLVLLALSVSLMGASGGLAIVRFKDFTLKHNAERFSVTFGLLDAREHSLRQEKLHAVEFVRTGVGRLLDTWHVIAHQTGASAFDEMPGMNTKRFFVPGVRSARLAQVVGALHGRRWVAAELRSVDRRLRDRRWLWQCTPCFLIATLIATSTGGELVGPTVLFVGLGLLLASVAQLRWRRWGWHLQGPRLVIRSGLVDERWLIFDLDRCQQARVSSSPYQRRHGLATLTLGLPHGAQQLPYVPAEVAAMIANRSLLAAERATRHAL